MTLGIIGGTSLLFSDLPTFEKRCIYTPFGNAELLCGDVVMLMRHQKDLPPHRINFRANLSALALVGVDKIVSIGSSGSLKPKITLGSIVIPTDYMSISDIPSIHDHKIEHIRPELSQHLSKKLSHIVPEAKYGGIYVQTPGPRIETIAEVQALAKFADIVGMTVASEATLACELDMEFAALCTVDNYANGLGEVVLTYEHILATSRSNRYRTEQIVSAIIKKLG
ncbi:MAG: MTAP family purine nucleoside phosphorylase [Methanoregulaceae archaeon]|jgi:5'-methylthioadenosine phosphorylase